MVRVWLGTVLLLTASVGQAQTTDFALLEEFRAEVKQWTAGAGSVVFSSQPPDDSKFSGRRTSGFDPATGAWFVATHYGASGRTADGIPYDGTPDKVSPMEDQALRLPAPMESYIPMALPLMLLDSTDGLLDISKDASSNWVIDYLAFALEGAERPHAQMVFSPEGKPLRFKMDARPSAGRDAIAYDYEFEPDSREPLLITVQRSPHPRMPSINIVEVDYYPTSRPELFTTEAVLALAVDNRMRTQMRLNAVAARMSDSGSNGEMPENTPYVMTRLGRAGLPLVITGIIVVGLGIMALIRSRSGR